MRMTPARALSQQLNPLRHGATKGKKWSPTYTVWHGLLQRCLNRKNPSYPRYGGRGITVCAEWRGSFETFLADMGERPSGTSINRIDNDGSYCKANCQWATETQQQRNKSSNRAIAFRGRTQSLAAWAEELGIPYFTIHARLRRDWPIERALSEPANGM